jgi:hypothetical protein
MATVRQPGEVGRTSRTDERSAQILSRLPNWGNTRFGSRDAILACYIPDLEMSTVEYPHFTSYIVWTGLPLIATSRWGYLFATVQ